MNRMGIDEALRRLNQKMVYGQIDPIQIVVCGGAALILNRLITRSTRDVDILAIAKATGKSLEFSSDSVLPPEIKGLVQEVALELGIEENWLNFGPNSLLKFGLPPGLVARLKKKPYGACLTLFFISRLDQIHFKLYAAMDPQDGTRHLSDLLDLKPTGKEVRTALDWLLARPTSAEFRETLKQVLERIGYEHITGEI